MSEKGRALLEHLDEVRGKPLIMPPDDTVTGYARGRADGYQAGVLSLRELERGLQVAAEEAQIERDLARQERDAARARIAELEREVEKLRDAYCEAKEDLDAQGQAVSLAYIRGAKTMREAAAQHVERRTNMNSRRGLGVSIRELPLPEDRK